MKLVDRELGWGSGEEVLYPVLPLTRCVTLGESFHFSVPLTLLPPFICLDFLDLSPLGAGTILHLVSMHCLAQQGPWLTWCVKVVSQYNYFFLNEQISETITTNMCVKLYKPSPFTTNVSCLIYHLFLLTAREKPLWQATDFSFLAKHMVFTSIVEILCSLIHIWEVRWHLEWKVL